MPNLDTSQEQLAAMIKRFGLTFTLDMLASVCDSQAETLAPHDLKTCKLYRLTALEINALAGRIAAK